MSSLLDQVLKNKDNPSADSLFSEENDSPHQLPDGGVVYDSTLAAIKRILSINPHLHKRETGIASEPYRLYNGHTPVDLSDKKTFLLLLRADWTPVNPWQVAFLCEKVLELAPVLSRDCVIISDGLIWDRVEGKLKNFEEGDNIKSVW